MARYAAVPIVLLAVLIFAVQTRVVHEAIRIAANSDAKVIEEYMTGIAELERLQRELFGMPADSEEDERAVNATEIKFRFAEENPSLFEGDIVLTLDQLAKTIEYARELLEMKKLAHSDNKKMSEVQRTITSDLSLRWITFPIPYVISGADANAVRAGIKNWEEATCVTFREVSSIPSRSSGLQFIKGQGCYSNIGRYSGGSQTISIGDGCTSVGTVAHEIGHALGYYHEQARYDRDSYVKILTDNIQSGYLSQFSKQSPSTMITYGVQYDLGSAMHYPSWGFSKNGLPTIQSIDSNYQNTFGQRDGLSFNDHKKINFAYCNGTCKQTISCQNEGYTDPKDCTKCRCPSGLGGVLCDRALTSLSACGTTDLAASSTSTSLSVSGIKSCNYVIKAPAGNQIFIEFTNFRFRSSSTCTSDYVEVKYGAKMGATGARFCGSHPSTIKSTTNMVIILYRGAASNSAFGIKYSYAPSAATPSGSTVVPSSKKPLSTVTTSTSVPSTTKPKKTTSKSPKTETTTAPTKKATTTPCPTTKDPHEQWSEWSMCTASCGACGEQIRYRGKKMQHRICNLRPCRFGWFRCCRPFLYTNPFVCVLYNPHGFARAAPLPGYKDNEFPETNEEIPDGNDRREFGVIRRKPKEKDSQQQVSSLKTNSPNEKAQKLDRKNQRPLLQWETDADEFHKGSIDDLENFDEFNYFYYN